MVGIASWQFRCFSVKTDVFGKCSRLFKIVGLRIASVSHGLSMA